MMPAAEEMHGETPPDHGVHAFDPDLAARRYRAVAQGAFRILRTASGRTYACLSLHTALGQLCAAVLLERTTADRLLEHARTYAYGEATVAAPMLEDLGLKADQVATLLEKAAHERGTSRSVLAAARLLMRARMGDLRARMLIRQALASGRTGDADAKKMARTLKTARQFAREALGATETTGGFFDDIGHAISHAVRDVSRAVEHTAKDIAHVATHVVHDVEHVVRDVSRAVGPVLNVIKQWGPLVLSTIHGIVSLIPGIGTGISAALSLAEALLSGQSPLEIVIHVAYGAIPIPAGIRRITDIVLDTVLEFIKNPKHFVDAALAAVRDRIPKGLPQEVFDTLIRIVVKREPILRVAGDLALHYVEKYTAGLAGAVTKGLGKIPEAIAAHLPKLPDLHIHFASIIQLAPHFTIPAHIVPDLVSSAQHKLAHLPADLLHVPAEAVRQAQAAVHAHAVQLHALVTAQARHMAPRLLPHPSAGIGASLAIELSADGRNHRVVSTGALAHLAAQMAI
jgi:hypothetical protein